MTGEQAETTSINFTEEVVKIWYQNKKDLNFGKSSDSDFLIFILYNTLKTVSNKFSENIVLPPLSPAPCSKEPKKSLKPLLPTMMNMKHEGKHNPDPAPTVTPIITRTNLNPRHFGGMFECSKCKKSFATKAYLGKHDKRCGMNPLKMYHCQYCSMVLTSVGSLNIHIKQKHRDVRYSCEQCNKKFKNPEYVKHHIRVAHNKIKDYKCHLCDKSFTQRGSLHIHMKMVHQKLRDHPCRICDKQFGCKSHLTRHMRKLHSDVKELRCDICMKVFDNSHELVSHTKSTHYQTEFICNICNKAFVLKHTLAQHIIRFHQKEQKKTKQQTVAEMLLLHNNNNNNMDHQLNKDMNNNLIPRDSLIHQENGMISRGNTMRENSHIPRDNSLHPTDNNMLIGRENNHIPADSNLLPVVLPFLSNHPPQNLGNS